MGILSFISDLFKPAADLIDNVHTSTEEKLTLRNELADIQRKVNDKIIDLEKARLDAMSKIEIAEAGSAHWLRANWRPICSIIIVGIIVADSFGWIKAGVQIYDLAKIFLGAYTTSRGIEKVASVAKLGR